MAAATNNPIRFYQASSSEMFGKVRETPQSETTPFHPRALMGVRRCSAINTVVNYREPYGMHADRRRRVNHEGPRRGLSS